MGLLQVRVWQTQVRPPQTWPDQVLHANWRWRVLRPVRAPIETGIPLSYVIFVALIVFAYHV